MAVVAAVAVVLAVVGCLASLAWAEGGRVGWLVGPAEGGRLIVEAAGREGVDEAVTVLRARTWPWLLAGAVVVDLVLVWTGRPPEEVGRLTVAAAEDEALGG